MTDQYRWTSPKPLGRDDPVEQGDVFEPTEAELEAFGDLMAPVEDDSSGEADIDERAIDLADENYQTTVAAVEDGEADEFLDDLAQADDRETVQDAINARLEEV